ncbi:hypothetical protein VT52_009560 [Streptomyces malaysiense]|uniref:Uncharacterized protein n=1 Tax=Streptomyces malaysiense TaxID=1428626 RepID=A0A1J4Q6X3_9ACTN|nr:hypothetical protein VT52_009560 [Streptomyces malaysiense]
MVTRGEDPGQAAARLTGRRVDAARGMPGSPVRVPPDDATPVTVERADAPGAVRAEMAGPGRPGAAGAAGVPGTPGHDERRMAAGRMATGEPGVRVALRFGQAPTAPHASGAPRSGSAYRVHEEREEPVHSPAFAPAGGERRRLPAPREDPVEVRAAEEPKHLRIGLPVPAAHGRDDGPHPTVGVPRHTAVPQIAVRPCARSGGPGRFRRPRADPLGHRRLARPRRFGRGYAERALSVARGALAV